MSAHLPQALVTKGIMEGKSSLLYFLLENAVKVSLKKNSTVCSPHSFYKFSYFSLVSRDSINTSFLPSNHEAEIAIALDLILFYYFIVIKKTVM